MFPPLQVQVLFAAPLLDIPANTYFFLLAARSLLWAGSFKKESEAFCILAAIFVMFAERRSAENSGSSKNRIITGIIKMPESWQRGRSIALVLCAGKSPRILPRFLILERLKRISIKWWSLDLSEYRRLIKFSLARKPDVSEEK